MDQPLHEAGKQAQTEREHHDRDDDIQHAPGRRLSEDRRQQAGPEAKHAEPQDTAEHGAGGEPPSLRLIGTGNRAQKENGVEVNVGVEERQGQRCPDGTLEAEPPAARRPSRP